jgi:hypothetical protein
LSDFFFDETSGTDFFFAFGELSTATGAASVLCFDKDFEDDFGVGFGTDFVPLAAALFLADADSFAAVLPVALAEAFFTAFSTIGVFDAESLAELFATAPDAFLAAVAEVVDLAGFAVAVFAVDFCSAFAETVFGLARVFSFFAAAGITCFSLRAGMNGGKTTALKPTKTVI